MTKIYKVMASSITYYAVCIEADSEQEAYDIAVEMDGSSFKQLDWDWQTDDAVLADEDALKYLPLIKKEEV